MAGQPALILPISGAYLATWNAFYLGVMNDDGFVLMANWTGQEVNLSDAFGMVLCEAIYRGMNWRIRFRGLEWNRPGILASMQAFGSTGAPSTTFTPLPLDNVGDRYSKFAQPLVMTADIGTNPPTTPQTLTALNSIVSPNSNSEYIMTSKVREAPFEMALLPYLATVGSLSVNTSFTTT